MKFYHFTSNVHIASVRKKGLTLGVIPVVLSPIKIFEQMCQWLTTNPDFSQSWNIGSTLPYDRNEYRLEIEIPNDDKNLFKWIDICHKYPLSKILNEEGDPENWYVYKGNIPPEWIIKIERKQTILTDCLGPGTGRK